MNPKSLIAFALAAALALPTACAAPAEEAAALIDLNGGQVTVDGQPASRSADAAVYVGADILYYHDGTDQTYGEGEESEKHTSQEAAAHTVVTVTQPGTYRLTGDLPQGQIAIDLGEGAKDDPSAVVTLILDNASVKCTVAPALIFYNVYECDRGFAEQTEGWQATWDVDTAEAGANVILAAGSVNTFQGSHVARIYKEGTTENLHRYDGAFYSKMSMNIDGENGDDSGLLSIIADNEGLDTELHLTLNGGTVNIYSQDDGINTNEDNVSVATINGGSLTVNAGNGAEGDGIDSNGWLVINGGTVTTMSNDRSADGGVDADRGILLGGGTLSAFGVRNDSIDGSSKQPYMELSFAQALPTGSILKLTDQAGGVLWSATTQKSCQTVTLSTPVLALDTSYQLYVDDTLQSWSGSGASMGRPGGMGGQRPEGMPEPPQGTAQPPEDMPQPPQGTPPTGEAAPSGSQRPDEMPEPPEGMAQPPQGGFGPGHGRPENSQETGEGSTDFTLTAQIKSFSGVRSAGDGLPFTDVAQDDSARGHILTLYRRGIVQGDGAGRFFPDAVILPEHWQLMLERLSAAGADISGLPGCEGLTRRAAAVLAAEALQ